MKILQKKTSDLKPYSKNARTHSTAQIDMLVKSIEQFGFNVPILIDSDNVIIAGHGRLLAAKQLGMDEVPTIYIDHLSEVQKKAFILADNKIAEHAGWDKEVLSAELREVSGIFEAEGGTIKDIGFEHNDILTELDAYDSDGDFIGEDTKKQTRIRQGDLLILGRHKVLCGDCTEQKNVDLLLGDETVDSLQTDPPYGVNYGEKEKVLNEYKGYPSKERRDILNDDLQDYQKFFSGFLSKIKFSEYSTIYCWMGTYNLFNLLGVFLKEGIYLSTLLVWVKNQVVLGRADYNQQHELCCFCYYGWKEKHRFYGGYPSSVLHYDKPLKSQLHPTMKPFEMICQLVRDGSEKGGLVYDPFLGSGTTLIACDINVRRCYGMELDTTYCQVIADRYIAHCKSSENVYIIRDGKTIAYDDFKNAAK